MSIIKICHYGLNALIVGLRGGIISASRCCLEECRQQPMSVINECIYILPPCLKSSAIFRKGGSLSRVLKHTHTHIHMHIKQRVISSSLDSRVGFQSCLDCHLLQNRSGAPTNCAAIHVPGLVPLLYSYFRFRGVLPISATGPVSRCLGQSIHPRCPNGGRTH